MNRLVILEKDGQYAAIGRREIESPNFAQVGGVVGIFDNRQANPLWYQGFDTDKETDELFKRALATSKERGWTEIFTAGQALNNPVYS